MKVLLAHSAAAVGRTRKGVLQDLLDAGNFAVGLCHTAGLHCSQREGCFCRQLPYMRLVAWTHGEMLGRRQLPRLWRPCYPWRCSRPGGRQALHLGGSGQGRPQGDQRGICSHACAPDGWQRPMLGQRQCKPTRRWRLSQPWRWARRDRRPVVPSVEPCRPTKKAAASPAPMMALKVAGCCHEWHESHEGDESSNCHEGHLSQYVCSGSGSHEGHECQEGRSGISSSKALKGKKVAATPAAMKSMEVQTVAASPAAMEAMKDKKVAAAPAAERAMMAENVAAAPGAIWAL